MNIKSIDKQNDAKSWHYGDTLALAEGERLFKPYLLTLIYKSDTQKCVDTSLEPT